MRLVSNAAFLWGVRVATMVSSAFVSVLTARFLGPHGRGLYALPPINGSLAVTFAVGLSSAMTYSLLNRGAGRSVARSAVIGLLIFGFFGSIVTIATAFISHSLWAIVPALLHMMFYAANATACGYFIGRNRVRMAGAINGSAYLLTLCLVTIALFLYRGSAIAAIYAWVAAWGVTGSVGLVLALLDARTVEGVAVAPADLYRFAGKAGLLNLANLLNYRVDVYIVAMLLPVSTLSLYTLAVTGAESALSLSVAIAQSTLPRVGIANQPNVGVFVARCLRNGLFFALLLSAGTFLAAPIVVKLLLGDVYMPLVLPFRVLSIGVVAASTTAVLSNYFMMNRGRMSVPLTTSVLSASLCAAISFILVPRIGMLGAAVGSTVAYVVSQTIAIALFCRESGVRSTHVLFVGREDFSMYRRILRRVAFRHT